MNLSKGTLLVFLIFGLGTIFSTNAAKAQTVGSEVFWLKPTNLSPNQSNKVDTWNSSGTEIVATQPESSIQPDFNPDLLNGNPGIDLDGSQFLELPGDIDFLSGNKTFIAFYRPDETTYSLVSKGRGVSGDGQNGDFSIVPYSSTYRIKWRENGEVISFSGPNLSTDYFYLVRLEINRNSGVSSLFINEQLVETVNCSMSFVNGNTTRPTYISNYLGAPQFALNGAIAEMGLFNMAGDSLGLNKILIDMGARYLPNIDLGEDVVLTPGSSCSIDFSLANTYDSVTWSTGDTTASITVTEPGEYYVVATGDYGFKVSDTVNVGFEENLIDSDYLLCSYDSLEWDLGLEDGYSYTWSDGLETTESTRYLQPGASYSVEISNGNCSTTTPVVNVESDNYSETVELTENPTFCLGNELYLSSGFDEAETYTWSTGEDTPFIHPQTSGQYWVEATNANGCVGRDTIDVDIVGTAPYVQFTSGTACEDNAVEFTDGTFPEGATITSTQWTFPFESPQGADTLQGPVVDYTFPGTGDYPVELTVTLDNGCTGTGRDTVTVHPLPLVGFNFDEVTPCRGNEVAFESQSGVPGNGEIGGYAWTFGNGTTDTGIVGSTTFEEMGTNTVQLAVTTTEGCVDSLLANVVVLGSPVVDFDFDDVCAGAPVVFTEDVNTEESGSVFYNWQFGDGYFSNFPNTSHVYASSGVYNVTLTATGNDFGSAGCMDTLTKAVRVYAPPVGAIATTDGCLGTGIAFTDLTEPVSEGGVKDAVAERSWVLPFGSAQGPVELGSDSVEAWMPEEAGVYAVDFGFETEAGCTGSASGEVEVLDIPESAFSLEVPEEEPPLVVVPENMSTGAEGYAWLMDGAVVSNEFEPELLFADTGDYTVGLAAVNSLGCNDTSFQAVTVISPVYDIALLDIRYAVAGDRLVLKPLLGNNGNVAIGDFRVNVVLGLSADVWSDEYFEIDPGDVAEFTLPQEFEYLASRDLPYVCMEVELVVDGEVVAESDSLNNYMCVGLEKDGAVFVDPYPNPGSGDVKLGFVLPVKGKVDLEVVDEMGRLVGSYSWNLEEGYSFEKLDVRGWSEGIYFLRYSYLGEVVVKKLVVVERK